MKTTIKTVFMGAPEFSTPTLQALLNDSAYEVAAVVTQPDRRAGRGRKLTMTPVKKMALAAGVPALQPASLRDPAVFAELASYEPDLIVVAAFGQILRSNVLELPRFGCINVHASLLPRWRGASPIQAAILAGDPITGSTIMRMDKGMDTGPILAQAAEVIRPNDTAAALSERLARQGAQLLMNTLPCYIEGKLAPRAQDDAGATVCRLIKKEHARIDWTQPAEHIERMVRAYNPWPIAFTFWRGQMLKVGRARVVEGAAEPGRVIAYERGAAVGTGSGLLVLEQVQPAGKRMMSIEDFLRGRPEFIGSSLNG